MRLDIDELRAWTGRQEVAEDVVTPFPVAALAATLDRDDPAPAPGTPLPPLWHWLYFLPLHRQSAIGPDGHARRGGFLPPVPLPRRMWAGGRFEFRRPVRVGDAVRRTSTIADVSLKEGRTGPLAFVLVRHEVATGEGRGARRGARHRLPRPAQARRGGAGAAAGAGRRPLAPRRPSRRRAAVPLLGAHLHGHRIHYDRRYVTESRGATPG
jgi:3-methylfumaryl-CoA hydratase